MAKLRIGVLYDYWWDEDEERVEGERPRKKPLNLPPLHPAR